MVGSRRQTSNMPASGVDSLESLSINNQTNVRTAKRRMAIVNRDQCKPSQCHLECKKACPVNLSGKFCIEVEREHLRATIHEELCIGCNQCVKKCPFGALKIVNTPANVMNKLIHKYGMNSFSLYKMPKLSAGQICGLIGENGTGKSTLLNILSGQLKPNLGRYSNSPDWSEILKFFRGSEMMNYFKRIIENDLVAVIKPQHIDQVARELSGTVRQYLEKNDERDVLKDLLYDLELEALFDKEVKDLSGGELQRFCIAIVIMKEADVYMFDEPSSFLDVSQRVNMVNAIKTLKASDKYVVVIEHDLAIVDYLSDFVCLVYGHASAYGITTLPASCKEGINQYMKGYITSDNMQIRDKPLTFKVSDEDIPELNLNIKKNKYAKMTKTYKGFKLSVMQGQYAQSEVTVLVGPNGSGKSTFIKLLAGRETPDESETDVVFETVSYKPQDLKVSKKTAQQKVRQVLLDNIQSNIASVIYINEVLKPLGIESLYDLKVSMLSGGQLQRLFIAICLGHKCKPSMFLIDEPSAYLDVEQRLIVSKVIKRYTMQTKKTAFVVEHDLVMTTYLADQLVVFQGKAGVDCEALAPMAIKTGMNSFLKSLDITFRKDPENFRPRINKKGSTKDVEQKQRGDYFAF